MIHKELMKCTNCLLFKAVEDPTREYIGTCFLENRQAVVLRADDTGKFCYAGIFRHGDMFWNVPDMVRDHNTIISER